ncbi:pilus assembly protein [Pseudomonas sp. R-28-1W-6]|uniref:TadE/TadG family type IV pilus assembly protein n=1 Tax=Pseudomonas sp. R-28-1W-6 TaxID=2650101 RepID=UPI001365F5D9|nr:TadE family protein [Pseudomonas sp. R-28-1W-6]MWV12628.1 pilus assembly protein [Pseudomonas sp. R-28-1W-6]
MNRRQMRGVYVVEFAIIGLLLFIVLIGVLEMGRLFFTVNALNESARRGARLASVCDIQDVRILRRAIFNAAEEEGDSSLLTNLQTADLTLTYLNADGGQVPAPSDFSGADGFGAIRYVQLRIENFTFDLMIPVVGGAITLPDFRATLPRESLGRHAETGVVPEITPC